MQAYKGKYVFGFDVLRCVAIGLVVFSSLFFLVPNTQGIFSQLFSVAGVLGVEIFFVLSGFLMGQRLYDLYMNSEFSLKVVRKFLVKRAFRVLPLYYLAFLLNIGLCIYIATKLPHGLWKYVLFVQNFTSGISSSFFYESWPISIGVFTTIFGLITLYVLGNIKLSINRSRSFLIVVITIIMLCLFAKIWYAFNDNIKTMVNWNNNLKTVVIYRFDTLFYGVLAAYLSLVFNRWWIRLKYLMVVLGMALLFFIYLIIPMKFLFIETNPMLWNVWYLPLNSIAIILCLPAIEQWKSSSALMAKPLRSLSATAYSIYIIHFSLIVTGLDYFFPIENLPVFDTVVYMIVYLSALILFGYIIHKMIEKPIMNFYTQRINNQ